jgi:hypothetical protein
MATITTAISKDYRELVQYYKNILKAPNNDIALRWQNQFIWALARHLATEVFVVYPAFEKFVGGGGKISISEDQYEHQTVSPCKPTSCRRPRRLKYYVNRSRRSFRLFRV